MPTLKLHEKHIYVLFDLICALLKTVLIQIIFRGRFVRPSVKYVDDWGKKYYQDTLKEIS